MSRPHIAWRRFDEGAAVVGRGWFLRLWRLRILWAPPPDPRVTKVVMDEDNTLRITVTWQQVTGVSVLADDIEVAP